MLMSMSSQIMPRRSTRSARDAHDVLPD